MFRIFARKGVGGYVKGSLPQGDEDLSKLPQFWVRARIEKTVPIAAPDAALSWYGGKPKMPEEMPWPMDGEEPYIFLAQLHCADFPEMLWGGVGPRTGWLLFFVKPRWKGEDVIRVLHIDRLGPETHVPPKGEVHHLWRTHAIPLEEDGPLFPKWPVTLYEQAEGTPSRSLPYRADDPAQTGRLDPDCCEWPGGAAAHPLTDQGVESTLKAIIDWLRRLVDHAKAYRAREVARAATGKPAESGDNFVDGAGFVAAMDDAIRTNSAALEAVIALRKGHARAGGRLLSMSSWLALLTALEEISVRLVDLITIEPADRGDHTTDHYFDRLTVDRQANWADLASHLEERLHHIDTIRGGISRSLDWNKSFLERIKRKRAGSEILTVEEARREPLVQADVEKGALALSAPVEGRDRLYGVFLEAKRKPDPSATIDDDAWQELEGRLGEIHYLRSRHRVIRPGHGEVNDFRIRSCSIVDPAAATEIRRIGAGGWSLGFEAEREALARRVYATDAADLPQEVLTHFEPIWASRALHPHGSMGGTPSGWIGEPYFDARLFHARPDWNPDYESPPARPFDQDNAVLLELESDKLLGWLWGDLYSLVIVIPRADLARGRFDRIGSLITN